MMIIKQSHYFVPNRCDLRIGLGFTYFLASHILVIDVEVGTSPVEDAPIMTCVLGAIFKSDCTKLQVPIVLVRMKSEEST